MSAHTHTGTSVRHEQHTHAHVGSQAYLHTQMVVCTHGHTFMHVHLCHHTCTRTHKCTPYVHKNTHACAATMHTQTYKCLHAHAHTVCVQETLMCTCNMHARKAPFAHPCTCVRTQHTFTGALAHRAGRHRGHSARLRTSEEEEEEECRHIILFPLVQMTSLPGTNFCFGIFCYFIRSQRHGMGTKARGFTDGRSDSQQRICWNKKNVEASRSLCTAVPPPHSLRGGDSGGKDAVLKPCSCFEQLCYSRCAHLGSPLPVSVPSSCDICRPRYLSVADGEIVELVGASIPGPITTGLPKLEHAHGSPGELVKTRTLSQ